MLLPDTHITPDTSTPDLTRSSAGIAAASGASVAKSPVTRLAWLGAGLLMTALGIVGAMLPILPTTPFLIVAAGCFARSSPRLEAWLLQHKRFGPTLRAWRAHRAIAPRIKMLAMAGMASGYALFWFGARPDWLLALAAATPFICGAIYVLTRPSRPA